MSYPNQKKIKIHKPKYNETFTTENGPFMQVGVEEWQNVFKRYCKGKEAKPSVFAMYLYLASNADGHEKWLSSAAFTNATGMSRASYYRALDILEEDGYIYKDQGGSLNFATTPQKSTEIVCHDWEGGDSKKRHSYIKDETAASQECDDSISFLNREINNINNINKKQIVIDKAKRPFSAKYLKQLFSSRGEYLMGEKKGKWLEDEVPNLWNEEENKGIQMYAIANNTDFLLDEARIIARDILSFKDRQKFPRLKDVMEMDDYEDDEIA